MSRRKVGGDGEGGGGEGMHEIDAFGAEALVGVAKLPGVGFAFR